MKKTLLIPLAVLTTTHAFANDSLDKVYLLSNQTMDAVTRTKDFPSDGKFSLNKSETDIIYAVGINDYLIGEHIGNGNYERESEVDCDRKEKIAPVLTKDYEKRKFRISAMAVGTASKFELEEKKKYDLTTYSNFMRTNGYGTATAPSNYEWYTLMSRFSDYDKNADPATNAKNLAKLLKKETGLNVPIGALASEFMYNDLITKPNDWKKILESSKDVLSFDEKIALVTKLGGNFQADYNYDRQKQDLKAKGVVPLNVLLEKLSTEEAGGVCRDVALAQSLMLKTLGVDKSYIVQYVANTGGHVTLVAQDPNDKNRVIKMNYGEIYSENAKKGMAAIEQDNTLPNVGMRYRLFDNEGKALTSVPTEMGSILREATGLSKEIDGTIGGYTLGKVSFGTDNVKGNVFAGKTTTGETITGVAFNAFTSKTQYLDAGVGASIYNAKADKSFYEMNETGFYANGRLGAKATVYEGKYGKLGGGAGITAEVLVIGVDSTSKANGGKLSKVVVDGEYGAYAKANYEVDVSEKGKLGVAMEVKGRLEKKNVANEGSYDFLYDSTVLIGKYDHKISENLTTSLAVAETLSKAGNSTAFRVALEKGYHKFSVTANVRNEKDNPLKFLRDQQNAVRLAYELGVPSGWNFKLEYGKNFDSKSYQIMGIADKKF